MCVADDRATASELVILATQLQDHPRSTLHRVALAHAAGDVIRNHGDATLRSAIELAPDLGVARAIRRGAEAACDTISLICKGMEYHARLFSIALVVRFNESMTTQAFDEQLTRILAMGPLLRRLEAWARGRSAHAFIWPLAWTFDDLSKLSLGDVHRQACLAGAAAMSPNRTGAPPFPWLALPPRRGTTFLRYLVGYEVAPAYAAKPHDGGERCAHCTSSVLRASLPGAQEVAVSYDGRFYGPLWKGLHAYQRQRLAEVAATITACHTTASTLRATVVLPGERHDGRGQIGFARGTRTLEQRRYVLMLEPLADPVTIARIMAPLRRRGIEVQITKRASHPCAARPLDMKHRRRGVPRSPRFELTLPL